MQNHINRFFESQSKRWTPRTAELYRWYLENLDQWLQAQSLPGDPSQVSQEHLLHWMDANTGWGDTATYAAVVAVKQFFRWAVGREESPAEGLLYPKRKPKPQRTLEETHIMQILASLDTTTPKGVRDTAIIMLLLDTGLRASELCGLQRYHVDMEEHTFIARIKGGRWSDGVFSAYTAGCIGHWLDHRPHVALPETNELFVSIGGTRPGTGLTQNGLRAIFRRISRKVGFLFSPHDFRRTFATMAIRNGAPSRLVQVAGRWNSLAMVERYSQSLKPADMEPYSPVNKLMGLRFDPDDKW